MKVDIKEEVSSASSVAVLRRVRSRYGRDEDAGEGKASEADRGPTLEVGQKGRLDDDEPGQDVSEVPTAQEEK